jgi:hypothetical protein
LPYRPAHAIRPDVKHPVTGVDLPAYRYEPDEKPKKKHHWDEDRAGFVFVKDTPIGKCPVSPTNDKAAALLNDGIPWANPRVSGNHPDRIYVVHDGVVYRATSTNAGRSYHGFPELPRRLRELDKKVKRQILERAASLGQEAAVRAWFERDVRAESKEPDAD